MATCPNCGGFLDEEHRCTGVGRRRAKKIAASAVAILLGALAGTGILWLVSTNPADLAVGAAVLIGAIVGQAVLDASGH